MVEREIGPLVGIRQDAAAGRSKPRPYKSSFSNVTVYPHALPQYNLGHGERLAAIDQSLKNHPNLDLIGNYLTGPSIGSCVERSLWVADQIIRRRNA